MRDDLLAYYERELIYLRQMGAEFRQKYKKIADRLELESDRCADPHVERLLEAFAFLAARIHLKVDDEFPQITESLLNILYPHYLRPIPSMTVAEFQIDPQQNTPPEGLLVPPGSVMHSRPVRGLPLKFRNCYPVTLFPMTVTAAQWTTLDRLQPKITESGFTAALRVNIRLTGSMTFDQLDVKSLRFFLNGPSALIHSLYELLCNNCAKVMVRDPDANPAGRPFMLSGSSLYPVGFAEDEGVLPYPRRSFVGYRLLQEYFSFPEKFFFLDLNGLSPIASSGYNQSAEIIFLISPFQRRDRQRMLEQGVSQSTLRLGCSPVVNLFSHSAEPFLVSQTRYEYPIVPDFSHPKAMEVFSVDEVVGIDSRFPDSIHFQPFYSQKYGATRRKADAFWHATRRRRLTDSPSKPADDESSEEEPTEVLLSLVDISGRPIAPNVEALTVRLTCTNSNLPADMPFGYEKGDLDLQGVVPVKRIMILQKPSATIRPPLHADASWRLISHLSLNYLSLNDDGKDALQHILRLYNFGGSDPSVEQIEGIKKVTSKRRFARILSDQGIGFGRGTAVELELDEEKFVGGGVYLFASVLENFFSLYVSMNSFCELTARTKEGVLKHWQPRTGRRILL